MMLMIVWTLGDVCDDDRYYEFRHWGLVVSAMMLMQDDNYYSNNDDFDGNDYNTNSFVAFLKFSLTSQITFLLMTTHKLLKHIVFKAKKLFILEIKKDSKK